jgi:hypothetical protein
MPSAEWQHYAATFGLQSWKHHQAFQVQALFFKKKHTQTTKENTVNIYSPFACFIPKTGGKHALHGRVSL